MTRVRATVRYPDGADGVAAEAAVDGDIEVRVGGLDGPLRLALSISTDGSGLCASDGRKDHYQLQLDGERGALLLDGFTTLRRTAGGPLPLFGRGGTLVKDGSYGRRECVASLLAAVKARGGGGGGGGGGEVDAEEVAAAERLITAREGRNAQRLVDAIRASNGEWVDISYD